MRSMGGGALAALDACIPWANCINIYCQKCHGEIICRLHHMSNTCILLS